MASHPNSAGRESVCPDCGKSVDPEWTQCQHCKAPLPGSGKPVEIDRTIAEPEGAPAPSEPDQGFDKTIAEPKGATVPPKQEQDFDQTIAEPKDAPKSAEKPASKEKHPETTPAPPEGTGAIDATIPEKPGEPEPVKKSVPEKMPVSEKEKAPEPSADPEQKPRDKKTIPVPGAGGPLDPPTMIDEGVRTKKVSDRYEVLNELGRGGMGAVYRARDLKLGRIVALKRILELHDKGVARFMQEARTVARLNHTNIVTVHDTGEDEIGPWLVMEYIKGGRTLATLVEEKGALSEKTVVSIGLSLCKALSYAHRMGVIHRDVKPGNVLLAPDGTLKLTDFGLAREGRGSDLSKSGFGMGTGGFAAPEQLKDAKNVDHRADIYGLGALLYQVSTGKRPHVIKESAIPERLQPILMKALAEQPEDRFFDINELAGKLTALLKEPAKEKKKRAFSFGTILIMLIVVAGLTAGSYYGYRYYKNKQIKEDIRSTFLQLYNSRDQLKWDKSKLKAAQNQLNSLMEYLDQKERRDAESFSSWIYDTLDEADAIEELKELEDIHERLQGNENALLSARDTLSNIKERIPEDFDLRVKTLENWYAEQLRPFEQLTLWDSRRETASGNEEELRSMYEEVMAWEERIPSGVLFRYEAIKDWIQTELEPFDFLAGIEEEWDAMMGEEEPMRRALQRLRDWEEPLPLDAQELYDRLVTSLEQELEFYDFLEDMEGRKSGMRGSEEALSNALGELNSWESRVPEQGMERYDELKAYILREQGRLSGIDRLAELERNFESSSLEDRKRDIPAGLRDLDGMSAELTEWDERMPGDEAFQRRFDSLSLSIKNQREFLQDLQEVTPYLEQPIKEFRDRLSKAKAGLQVFVNKYEEEDDAVIHIDVESARDKISEIEAEEEELELQSGKLAVIFGRGGTEERLAAARDFMARWPDHEEGDRVSRKIQELEGIKKRESTWARMANQGFRYKKEESFSCGGETNRLEIFVHEKTGLEFVLVPGGTFMMGSPRREADRSNDEGPRREVTIKPFLLCRTEVPQEAWQRIMRTTPWKRKNSVKEGPGFPATYIDWDDCVSFCEEAGLRLPSEAEWEYACRAGTETAFNFGDSSEELGSYAWYKTNASEKGERYAHAVRGKKPNAFGLLDMHGNVYEWCQDVWHDNYSDAPVDGLAWETEGTKHRIVRGGSWNRSAHHCRSANRSKQSTSLQEHNLGFRPAYSPR